MKHIARACSIRRSLRAAAQALQSLLLAAACGAAGLAWAQPVHLEQARSWLEPGASWLPPAHPPAGLHVPSEGTQAPQGALDVSLPHARHRALAASSATLQAPPEVIWYRLELPAQLQDDSPAEPLFLYLPRWQTIGSVAVYAGDRLVWRSAGSRVWNSFNRPLWLPLTEADGERAAPYVWLRMASQPGVGGAISSAWIGTQDELLWRWRVRSWLQTDLVAYASAAFLVIGLFAFGVWVVRRDEPMYAWFFAASVTHALRMAHFVVDDQPPLLPDAWFGWLSMNALDWTMVCLVAVAARVHRQPMGRLFTAATAAVLLKSAFTLPVTPLLPSLASLLPLAHAVTGGLFLLMFFAALWPSHARRTREGIALFAVVALNIPAAVHDFRLQTYLNHVEGIYLMPYTAILMFALFLVLAWQRYMGALAQAEAANAGLGRQLAERERALTASHQQLRELERQQTLAAERQRMMQDMHDGIGSSLISALRMVQHGRLSAPDTAQVLKDCIDDLKLAIDSLEPADADLLALLAAVRFRLAPRLQAAGITLRWSVQDLPPLHWLDPQSALHVLRIVQEVLTNILKHSGASTIDVATAHAGDEVVLRVRDDGAPFTGDVPASGPSATHGRGLANVRTRVQALHGRCGWAALDSGAEFSLWLPVTRP